MLRTFKNLYLFALLLGLGACHSTTHIVKSNRTTYPINAKSKVDSAIIKTYLPYKNSLDQEMSRVIGYSEVELTKTSDLPESVIGNFFADAVANQVKKIVPQVDFVFPTTKGGIRNDVAKGPITVAQVFEMMPFENQLVLFELKGTDVAKILKIIAASNGQPVAGLSMKIQDKQAKDVIINGQAFDINKTYRVVTSDYIGNGGDETQGFNDPISRNNIGLLVRDALLKEVTEIQAAGAKIKTKLDGRITKN